MTSQTLPAARFTREERLGLGVAVAAHVALVAWLALEPLGKPVVAPPERMTVSFADEVALESTASEPAAEAAPHVAPTLGEPAPAPEPLPRAAPEVESIQADRPAAAASRTPPKAAPSPRATTRPADQRARRRPDTPAGASRLGDDFLKGVPGAQATGSARNPSAARAGPQVAASLSQAIARQLKPNWTAPQGAEADLLVTVLSWELARDGGLAGRPRVVSQSGVTDANRAQKDRHAEQAIRAVQLAAPFELPEEHYDSWKRVTAFRFDRKLSQ